MLLNTGKVSYRTLQKYYKTINPGDPLIPVLDTEGNPIFKANIEGDTDYVPPLFDFSRCSNELISPPSSTSTTTCQSVTITEVTVDCFDPTVNVMKFKVSSLGITSVGLEIIKSGEIVASLPIINKTGEWFVLNLGKYLVGSVVLRLSVNNCSSTKSYTIPCDAPFTSTTTKKVDYPCYDFSIYREAFAAGPPSIDVYYYDCMGQQQTMTLTKGAPAICVYYQFRGPNTFTAVNPANQPYLLASYIIVGVMECGQFRTTSTSSTSTAPPSTSTTTQPGTTTTTTTPIDGTDVYWTGQHLTGLPFGTQAEAVAAACSYGKGCTGKVTSFNIGGKFTTMGDVMDSCIHNPSFIYLPAGWYWIERYEASPGQDKVYVLQVNSTGDIQNITPVACG